jgi:hypothetical protein
MWPSSKKLITFLIGGKHNIKKENGKRKLIEMA